MITVSPHLDRVLRKAVLHAFLLTLFPLIFCQTLYAQERVNDTRLNTERITISEEATSRMADFISTSRQEKQDATPAQKSADAGTRTPLRSILSANPLEITYNSTYFDTQAGDDFSFPEDTHDFCRVTFDETAQQDFTLDAMLAAGEFMNVELSWTPAATTFSDYDLYLFDKDGRPAGDPAGLFPDGSIGNAFQTDNTNLTELASVQNDGDEEAVFIVIDRFRGEAGNELTLNLSGNDDAFRVLEYVEGSSFTIINAVTDEEIGPLVDNTVINLDELGAPRPNFNIKFNTNGCEEGISFVLATEPERNIEFINSDDALPYALYGDIDADYNAGDLNDGLYIVFATPFIGPEGERVFAEEASVTFEILSSPDDTSRVVNFSLIDAATDLPIDGFNPLAEGALIDLVALEQVGVDINRLNIEANTTDIGEQIASVLFDGIATLEAGGTEVLANTDDGRPFSLYGDDNAGDFSDASLPTGSYTLSALPSGDAGSDPLKFVGANVSFTVLGPRIENYSLIDADLNDPIAGFDPIEEGSVIDLFTLDATTFNIKANLVDFTPPTIDFTRLTLNRNGTQVADRVENYRPYAVFGDCNTAIGCSRDVDPPFASDSEKPNYSAWTTPVDGGYTLAGTPFVNADFQYAINTLSFTIVRAAENQASIPPPEEIELSPNFPNPFNPRTTISFGLPESAFVRLVVYDMLGREVKVLVNGSLLAGMHEIAFDAGSLASGMYLYRLETPDVVQMRTMTLLK